MGNISNLLQNRLNVMFVLPDLERNDIAHYCVDLAIKIKEYGGLPVVISAGGVLLKELIRANIYHIQIPVNSCDFFQIYNNSKIIKKTIIDMKINIIHSNSRSSAFACLYAKKGTNAKLVTTVHEIYDNGLFFWKKLFNKYIGKSDAIIIPSMYAANYMVDSYKINPNKISIISNWIDQNNFYSDSISTERIINMANSLGISEEKRIISVIGNYKKNSDLYLLIDAVSQINRNDIVIFIISNKNINKSNLMKKVSSLNLEGQINVVDNIDISAMYSLSDVIVNISSKYDSFNLEMLKAEAIGRVVVSTNLGASPEIIIDNKTGKVVKSNSVLDLIDGINWALNLSEEDRKHISNQASKFAHFNFSQSTKTDNIISLYKNLLNLC